ncbi:MAG: PDZ domain-containing protein [Planctomycetota bacterium]|nr:PDZ domain-containing protein [Planctomycetota bacterium]
MHRSSRRRAFLLATLSGTVLPALASGQTTPNAGMLRWPDVSRSHIVFSYANDLWIVPKDGGTATPIASPPGPEQFPRFSPDGARVAFVGNYDGNRDLYVVPVAGGVAERVTHHPGAETLCDWTPAGDSLHFITNGLAGLARQTQAFTIDVDGGAYEPLPVPYSGFGAISPDGTWLAYTPHSTDSRTWKRYRGGMATDVWLFNLKDKSSRRVTDWEGTDTIPMWVPGSDGATLYYLSDAGREHRLNIWAYDVARRTPTQITTFTDDDVRWPSIGPGSNGRGEIVFQLGAKLMLLDLATKASREVKVTVPGDRPTLRARRVNAADAITSASISPTGKRVAIEARGDIWSAPAKEGVVRNFTRTDGVAERDPAWSPGGKWIAYFSDEAGEYELWVRPSDAKPPEAKKDDDKKDDDAKKDDAKPDEPGTPDAEPKDDGAEKPAGDDAASHAKAAPRKLTNLGPGFRSRTNWSPDSKHIAFTDQGGRLFVTTLESGETREIDKDPWMNSPSWSWSHDSAWLAYTRADDRTSTEVIWIANVATGEKTRVTSGMFAAGSPAFDRTGDYLFYRSAMAVNNPEYSDLDSTYAYRGSEVILMTPLRADVKNPMLPKSDEETLKKDDKKDSKKDADKKDSDKKDADKKDADKKDADKKDDDKKDDAAPDDGVSGRWTGTATGASPELAAGMAVTMTLTLGPDGRLTGTITSAMGSGDLSGTYDRASGQLDFTSRIGENLVTFTGTLKDGAARGRWTVGDRSGDWSVTRDAGGGQPAADGKPDAASATDAEKKPLVIELDGLEARAMPLPVAPGNFGGMGVADGNKLIFSRTQARGSGETGIRVIEYLSDEREEKGVTGAGGWELSADGKKLLVIRGSSIAIHDPAAGGGKAQTVPTAGMQSSVRPREEWRQIFDDAWRIMRDYYYEPTMHGVDWAGMKAHYGAMLDDAASRDDVNWIIAEMISELNVGHAYLSVPGDVEDQPSVGVGMLGCDFERVETDAGGAYRISRILGGAAWDADARSPLAQPGVDAKVGDYLLAVNGVPVDASRDPWAALVGKVNQTVSLTLNARPEFDGAEREVVVKTIPSEVNLRYRAWIEAKRAYVAEKSGGKVGYIYVPNTGVDGQNDLYRQFFGQRGTEALIIDERWNGGGQIPTRFIELLNRPVTNYWARREGNDWPWPPDAHFGPKCMLINGLAGSGGDMFPWLFRHNKLGPLIGTRTWGGLVGISGNPRFVDGGAITVPTFGFYETDGTWGVEGHGTDPDIEVIDDPARMTDGGDPQLDRAIDEMLKAVRERPYRAPKRPASPNRKGMGIPESDR